MCVSPGCLDRSHEVSAWEQSLGWCTGPPTWQSTHGGHNLSISRSIVPGTARLAERQVPCSCRVLAAVETLCARHAQSLTSGTWYG